MTKGTNRHEERYARATAAAAGYRRRQNRGSAESMAEFLADHEELVDLLEIILEQTLTVPMGHDTESDTPWQEMPTQIGPYRILDVLGTGGMGVVYLAEQREPVRRNVALKVIKLGMDSEEVLRRFELERQALGVMNHPSIAKVYDAGITDHGQPYFVMELVDGIRLTDFCDLHRLSLKVRINIFQQVCLAVQHAHQKNVLHRDLKPANILVSRDGAQIVVKIIDFGLARATGQRRVEKSIYTEQGKIIGTPDYMSPEQARGKADEIDTRTDIYSLGVVLYQLLTGELPFRARDLRRAGLLEIYRVIQEEDPETPSSKVSSIGDHAWAQARSRRLTPIALRKNLKGELDWIVMKAMAKEPERRYASATELALDLRRYLLHEPVKAKRSSAAYRASKMMQRNRTEFVAGAIVLAIAIPCALLLLSFAGGFRQQEARAMRQERAAEANRTRADAQTEIARRERQRADESDAHARRLQGLAASQAAELRRLESADQAGSTAARRQADVTAAERRKSAALQRLARTGVDRFNDLAARFNRVTRRFHHLAVASRLQEASASARALHPAWPENLAALGRAVREGQSLLADLPRIRLSLREIEARALLTRRPQSARCEEYLEQLNKVIALQRSMNARSGKADDARVPMLADVLEPADELNARAWALVKPDREPAVYGHEPLGLALARRAVASDSRRHEFGMTEAWALFANGRDNDARDASANALRIAPAAEKKTREAELRRLEAAIRDAGADLTAAREQLARLAGDVYRSGSLRFVHPDDRLLHRALRRLENDLLAFANAADGPTDLQRRRRWAGGIAAATTHHGNARFTWAEARAAIKASSAYSAVPIDLPPQWGLVPIGENPVTRLWEFYHLRSAQDPSGHTDPSTIAMPRRRRDFRGTMEVRTETGIVFVLIPGGKFLMGTAAGTSSHANGHEMPQREVTLAPFFIARHELTQGQWLRLSGEATNPSRYHSKIEHLRHPVERVSFDMCRNLLDRHGLVLPTEAQWEYACRARSRTEWSCGSDPRELQRAANLFDLTARAGGIESTAGPLDFRDGFTIHAPVGRFRQNDFGLHDVHGNVWEWCADRYLDYTFDPGPGDGERRITGEFPITRVVRGGGFDTPAARARCAARHHYGPSAQHEALGVRPARRIHE